MRSATLVLGAASLTACVPSAKLDEPISTERISKGQRAYQRCFACHALSQAEGVTEGPALGDIVGRPVASEPGYQYSPAMRAYATGGKRWTRERLDAFLTDPQAEVPGNAMGFFGIVDPVERAALIAWLAQQESGVR